MTRVFRNCACRIKTATPGSTPSPASMLSPTKLMSGLLDKLADKKFEHLTPQLQENILEFYADLNAPFWTKRDKKAWTRTLANLELLRAATPAASEHL